MPVNPNLDINYTPVQETAIDGALDTAKTELQTVVGAPLNLSASERTNTPSVDSEREPFVTDAITNLASQFPNMLGPEVSFARAQNLWAFRNTSQDMLARVDAFRDMLIDAVINAETLCLKFTEDMRDNAQRFKERNVPGADVVWERLKDLHTVTPNPQP